MKRHPIFYKIRILNEGRWIGLKRLRKINKKNFRAEYNIEIYKELVFIEPRKQSLEEISEVLKTLVQKLYVYKNRRFYILLNLKAINTCISRTILL